MGRGRQGPSAPEPRSSPTAAPLHSHCLAAPGISPDPFSPPSCPQECQVWGFSSESSPVPRWHVGFSGTIFLSYFSAPNAELPCPPGALCTSTWPPAGASCTCCSPELLGGGPFPKDPPLPARSRSPLPRAECPHPDPCLFGTQKLWQHPHLTPPPAGLAASCLYGLFSLLLAGSW